MPARDSEVASDLRDGARLAGAKSSPILSYWYVACRSKELKKKPVAITILEKHLVLFRGPDDRAAALEDSCLHRGAALSGGTASRGTLMCPYHGWRYATDGRVAQIPSMPEGCAVPPHLRTISYPSFEQDGFVWVCLSDSPATKAPRRFPLLDTPAVTTFVMKTPFRAPVEDCLENFLDCPHATTVHRMWFRSPVSKPVQAIVRTLPDGAVAEYIDEPREKSAVFRLLSQNSARMTHTDRFIAPATSEVDYQFSNGDRCMITSTCRPVHDRLTVVYTVMSFRFRLYGPLVRLVFHPMSRIIITQDVRMLDRQQDNLKRFKRPHRYNIIQQDLLAAHIWQWRNALKAGTPPPEPGYESHVEMRF